MPTGSGTLAGPGSAAGARRRVLGQPLAEGSAQQGRAGPVDVGGVGPEALVLGLVPQVEVVRAAPVGERRHGIVGPGEGGRPHQRLVSPAELGQLDDDHAHAPLVQVGDQVVEGTDLPVELAGRRGPTAPVVRRRGDVGLVAVAETALSAISAMVVATALLGMVTMILTTLNERRREMAILRSCGARPATILGLLAIEGGLLTLAGTALGTGLLYAGLLALRPTIDRLYGLSLPLAAPSLSEGMTLAGIVAAGFLAALLPAVRAYRLSLADGMTVRN